MSKLLSELLLPEYDQEMATTRRFLERIPEENLTWKPHDKSMTLGRLASHLAEIPAWMERIVGQDELDIAPPGAPPREYKVFPSRAEALDVLDRNVAAGRTAINDADDEKLRKNWSLLAGGNVVFTLPRFAVLRNMVLNHAVHHRAQLGVYFRLNEVPVPSTYGPSADESGM